MRSDREVSLRSQRNSVSLRLAVNTKFEPLLNRSLLYLEFAQGCSLVDFIGIEIF
jgi:hypothetical protein